jgi:predicted NBD/HSP70 family sugar kinase
MEYLWGIDLGGTKVEGVILKIVDNAPEVKTRLRVPTEAGEGYSHILDQVQKLVKLMEDESGLKAEKIGFGTPGALDPSSRKLKNSNTTCLNGQAFHEDLENKLKLAVRMANDANCFALAETKFGIVRDKMPEAKVVFGTIMGTGVGGGLIVEGKVIGGKQGIGGEWGHNHLDDSGGPCYCGKLGCVEQVISGPALERYYFSISKKKARLQDIVTMARNKTDLHAVKTLDRLLTMFGKGISVLINIIDPDVIVLGGGLGNIQELYTKGVVEAEKHVFNSQLETKFLKPQLGDSAGVFGAALLFA